MSSRLVQQIALVILLIVFVLLLVRARMQARSLPTPGGLALQSQSPVASATPSADQQKGPNEVGSPLEGLPVVSRDPFQLPLLLKEVMRSRELIKKRTETQPPPEFPLDTPVEAPRAPPLHLQGIMWGGDKPQAIINRQIVSAGDRIGDARIVKIKRDAVTVSFTGREYQLELPKRLTGSGVSEESSGWSTPQLREPR